MVDASAVSVIDSVQGFGLTILRVDYTKANADDDLVIPSGYGDTVVWCDLCELSSLVKDPATAVSDLTITTSVGTGAMSGLVMVT